MPDDQQQPASSPEEILEREIAHPEDGSSIWDRIEHVADEFGAALAAGDEKKVQELADQGKMLLMERQDAVTKRIEAAKAEQKNYQGWTKKALELEAEIKSLEDESTQHGQWWSYFDNKPQEKIPAPIDEQPIESEPAPIQTQATPESEATPKTVQEELQEFMTNLARIEHELGEKAAQRLKEQKIAEIKSTLPDEQ